MNKQFLLVLAAIAVMLGGIFWAASPKNSSKNSNTVGHTSSHIRGDTSSKVHLTEFGDFECPACEAYYPLVEKVYSAYKTRVAFQFREFPLTQIHPNAMAGARAAEAASLQGKFWPMYHKLYDNQNVWANSSNPIPYFDTYAKQIGLNMSTFSKDFKSNQVNNTINADIQLGQSKYNVNGTPTFVLNGKVIKNNPTSVAGFEKLLNQALASTQSSTTKK